jgi:hypothetical protein
MQQPFGANDHHTTEGRAGTRAVRDPATGPRPVRSHRASTAGQIGRAGARGRLERELRSIAINLLGPNEADESSVACAAWIAATMSTTVSKVCDTALDALVRELDARLADAPPDVVRELRRARLRHEAGFA